MHPPGSDGACCAEVLVFRCTVYLSTRGLGLGNGPRGAVGGVSLWRERERENECVCVCFQAPLALILALSWILLGRASGCPPSSAQLLWRRAGWPGRESPPSQLQGGELI